MQIHYKIVLIFAVLVILVFTFVGWKLCLLFNPLPDTYSGQVEVFGQVEEKIVRVKGESAPTEVIDEPEENRYVAEYKTTFTDLDDNLIDLFIAYDSGAPEQEQFKYDISVTIPEREEKILIDFNKIDKPIEKPVITTRGPRLKIPLFAPALVGGYMLNYNPDREMRHGACGGVGIAIKKTVIPFIDIDTRGWFGVKLMVVF